jgi:hypothetical protein
LATELRAALVVFCLTFAVAVPAAAFQAQIRDIHVTQGVQAVQWDAGDPHGFPPQPGNTVPLIAHRSTAVRVLVDVQLGPGEAPPSLSGELEITINGQLVYGMPIPAVNQPFIPPAVPDLRNENDTLNFIIRPPALIFPFHGSGPDLESADVDVFVRISPGPGGQPYLSGAVNDLTVVSLSPVNIAAVPVTWVPTASGPGASFIVPGRGDAFLAAALPIDDSCFQPHVCVLGQGTALASEVRPYRVVQGLSYDLDLDADGGIATGVPIGDGEVAPLLEDLQAWRNFCYDGGSFCPGLSADQQLFVYGWLPDAARRNFNGVAQPGANVALGFDSVAEGQGTLAHEFGHMLGLVAGGGHNPCPRAHPRWPNCPEFDIVPNIGLDVLGRIVNNPPGPLPPAGNGNGVTGRIKDFALHDLMNVGGGGTLPHRWLTIPTYLAMLDELKARDPRRTIARTPSRQVELAGLPRWRPGAPSLVLDAGVLLVTSRVDDQCPPTLRISGRVTRFDQTRDGQLIVRQARLNPAFRSERCWRPPADRTPAAQLVVEVTMHQGGRDYVLALPVDARLIIDWILDPKDPGAVRETVELGPFEASVPVLGTVVSVRLTDQSRKATFHRLTRTGPPQVRIVAPRPGATLARDTTVSWSAVDPDSAPAELMYHVSYSADGGASFIPVAVNRRKTQITFDASRYPASQGEGILRVLASDGLNTVTADVKGLTNPRR